MIDNATEDAAESPAVDKAENPSVFLSKADLGGKTCKPGDTLTRIAQKSAVSVKALRAANNLKTDQIKVGQKIKVPVAVKMTQAQAPAANSNAAPAVTQ